MNEPLPLCDARTDLKPIEVLFLQQLPEPSHELVESPQCELQREHSGVHIALAQASGPDSWWLVWAPGNAQLTARGRNMDRRLHEMDDCPATQGESEDECLLPARHAGAHSFEMESSGPRVPSAFARKKMLRALRESLDDDERAELEEMESLLASPEGDPLPLITQNEALVVTTLLGQVALDDWLMEDLVLRVVERMDTRMQALGR
ncbi:hypothetical protein [Streptomyces uncialis]|uniref:hypothetical protein n=1 Tax=Streptomyces uncialis TaxID=1048205 RepID=UPI002F937789|nr:hypothetical protein OG924_37435 [Streptomyces uncialis]